MREKICLVFGFLFGWSEEKFQLKKKQKREKNRLDEKNKNKKKRKKNTPRGRGGRFLRLNKAVV